MKLSHAIETSLNDSLLERERLDALYSADAELHERLRVRIVRKLPANLGASELAMGPKP